MSNISVDISKINEIKDGPVILRLDVNSETEFISSQTLVVCRCGETKSEDGFACDGSHKNIKKECCCL